MTFVRYAVPTKPAPNSAPHPARFKVKINRFELGRLMLREFVQYRGNLDTVLSRPCVYGVFDAPIGGFLPREQHCVGCLRCTIQHPSVVRVLPNPERLDLGDSYINPDMVETLLYEAASGRVPVRGAGYGGAFGGTGWDAVWTDMSEIVRPTRDGIHGREYISTAVHIGWKPLMYEPDQLEIPEISTAPLIELPIPILFDQLPMRDASAYLAAVNAAETLKTMAVVPMEEVARLGVDSSAVVPLVAPGGLDPLDRQDSAFKMIELNGWHANAYEELRSAFPQAVTAVRLPADSDLSEPLKAGVAVFHLTADLHGQTSSGFILDAIRSAHEKLILMGIREQITLIGSGGIAAAEHVPKAIIAGLDLVGVETALLIAMQAQFRGEVLNADSAQITVPSTDAAWAVQRLINLMGSWRDQLLEILGAMGLREVRRLRGEIGRAMFQADMEREAFAEIEGYG